jgi:hypothetical protein
LSVTENRSARGLHQPLPPHGAFPWCSARAGYVWGETDCIFLHLQGGGRPAAHERHERPRPPTPTPSRDVDQLVWSGNTLAVGVKSAVMAVASTAIGDCDVHDQRRLSTILYVHHFGGFGGAPGSSCGGPLDQRLGTGRAAGCA